MTQSPFAGELEANRFTVKRILERALHGDLRVPPFQRPMRWRRADHLLLLDSLYRGYPIGTLLLWRRAAEAKRIFFGDLAIDAGKMEDALWIVDGQQRITSIVGCLLRPESVLGRRSSEFAFCFDLVEGSFLVEGDLSGSRYVPVGRLRDPVTTSKWAREVDASDALHDKAQAVGARLLAYEIPVYVTSTESDVVLRTIFARANTAGKQMRREEVFEALNKGLNPAATPEGLTERLRNAVRGMNFGTVEDDDLQRALVCVAGNNPKDALPEPLGEPGGASEWEGATVEGLRRTVMFLREEAELPHVQALPYVLPIILLPRFFHVFPEPKERTLELLVRWVWRGIAGQTHMATNQQFNPHYKALRGGSEEAVAVAWLKLVARSRPASLPESELYNRRGMKTRLELAVLLALGPRSLHDGRELSSTEIFEADMPAAPPSLLPEERVSQALSTHPHVSDLPRLPLADAALRKLVAARFLHPEMGDGDRAFARALAQAPPEVLRSHGIDDTLEPAVRRRDWAAVVRGRAATIRRLTERTITHLARWGEDDDGPSIEASLVGDDNAETAP